MKYKPEKELLVVVILGLLGLIFLWLLPPVPVSIFNYLPLFLVSYLLAIFLPGYSFLSFIKPDMSFSTRLGWGIPLSLVFLFVVTFLFIFLQIPLVFTYAVSVLLILSLIMAFMTYLGEKVDKKGQEKIATPPRKPSPPEPLLEETSNREPDEETLKADEAETKEEEEKIILERPPQRKRRLIPPEGEVEIIIPDHAQPAEEGSTQKTEKQIDTSPEKPGLKLPWIERQKELDQEK